MSEERIINSQRVRDCEMRGYYPQANGKSYTYITCPFCGTEVKGLCV